MCTVAACAGDGAVRASAPRASPKRWIERGEVDGNDYEMLFLTLLLVVNSTGDVATTRKWAADVVSTELLTATELTAQWKPSGKVPNIFNFIIITARGIQSEGNARVIQGKLPRFLRRGRVWWRVVII